jgi:hypothetical protein
LTRSEAALTHFALGFSDGLQRQRDLLFRKMLRHLRRGEPSAIVGDVTDRAGFASSQLIEKSRSNRSR